MDTHVDFVAVIAILAIFGCPIAYAMSSRWYAHQERMAMIQRGMTPPISPRAARRYGPSGAAVPPSFDMDAAEWQANRQLHKGIVLAMIGLALFIGLSFINLSRPGAWLLGGLIPLFIGIAQIIIALLSGARLGGFSLGSSPHPGPSAATPPNADPFQPPPRDVTPGPYAWRPGTTTELERPPSPPDQR